MTLPLASRPPVRVPRTRPPRDARLAARARRAADTEDRALYLCDCGHAFRAEVSTSVGCPRCGCGQPW